MSFNITKECVEDGFYWETKYKLLQHGLRILFDYITTDCKEVLIFRPFLLEEVIDPDTLDRDITISIQIVKIT